MKKLFKAIFVVLILLSFTTVKADLLITERLDYTEGKYNDGSARKELDNYGVKKGIVVDGNNLPNILATPYVDTSLKIYDYAEVLLEDDEVKIKELIDSYISKTNMDLVFVTIDMPYTNDDAHPIYASDFFDYNDFGIGEYYSGVLFLRNTYSENPYYDIYMFGQAQLYYYGNRLDNMLDSTYDEFHSGQYINGFEELVSYLKQYYDEGGLDYDIDENGKIIVIEPEKEYKAPLGIIALIGGITDLIAIPVMVKKNKMVKVAYTADNYLDKPGINFNIKHDNFVSTHTVSHIRSDNSSGGGSGGGHIHSSTGSSGRGFTSGGGRHG